MSVLEFDYVFSEDTKPARLREISEQLGSSKISMQWISGGGGKLERSVSDVGLERWKIMVPKVSDLEAVEKLLIRAYGPVARHEIKMHPIYPAGDLLVGWVFWKRKEE